MEEVKLQTWQEFRDFVDGSRQSFLVLWRGQADPNWPLASAFERTILNMSHRRTLEQLLDPKKAQEYEHRANIYPYDGRFGSKNWHADFYSNSRDAYLAAFKRAVSGLRGPNPAELLEDQWWALGRHYGLITPLLDWTEKPYIAAFFALAECFSNAAKASVKTGAIDLSGKEVAIYRLHHNQQLEGDGLKVVAPLVEELGRIHGQRGLFTKLTSEQFFELQGFLDNTNRGFLLTRVLLSGHAVPAGLRDLEDHGIDYRSLFPDLMGAALQANMLVELSQLYAFA